MRSRIPCLAVTAALLAAAPLAFAQPRTMRVDYFHSGSATRESFAFERAVVEPLSWPGHPAHDVDGLGLGKYRFEVVDRTTRRVVFARGFSSLFGEWETTTEAGEMERTFSESLRFPMPSTPVQVTVSRRDRANDFRQVWTTVVDPADMFVDTAAPPSAGPVIALHESGAPPQKVDVLLLGDGYTAAERTSCEADLKRLTGVLLSTEPFTSRLTDLNVWGLCPAAAESGVSRPSLGQHRRSPAGTTYDVFRSERYMLALDNHAWRDLASQAPYDVVEIVTNTDVYGGGGIFGAHSTAAARSGWAAYLFIHEFGHNFAGLADEYFTSDVAYASVAERLEPWEPNVTAHPARDVLKWRDVVTAGATPTTWDQAGYVAQQEAYQAERRRVRAERLPESEMDALMHRERAASEARLGREPHAHVIGAFEGANYEAKGYYRPQVDCIMFTRNRVPFCVVCRQAIERMIDFHSRPAH